MLKPHPPKQWDSEAEPLEAMRPRRRHPCEGTACQLLSRSDSLRPHGVLLAGSAVHVIFQARILEWVAISFSNEGISVLLRGMSKLPPLHVRTQREQPSAEQREGSRQNQRLAPRPWTSQPSDGESLLWKPPVFGTLLLVQTRHLIRQC